MGKRHPLHHRAYRGQLVEVTWVNGVVKVDRFVDSPSRGKIILEKSGRVHLKDITKFVTFRPQGTVGASLHDRFKETK